MLYIVFLALGACLFGHYVIGMEAVSFSAGHKKARSVAGYVRYGHEKPGAVDGFLGLKYAGEISKLFLITGYRLVNLESFTFTDSVESANFKLRNGDTFCSAYLPA